MAWTLPHGKSDAMFQLDTCHGFQVILQEPLEQLSSVLTAIVCGAVHTGMRSPRLQWRAKTVSTSWSDPCMACLRAMRPKALPLTVRQSCLSLRAVMS